MNIRKMGQFGTLISTLPQPVGSAREIAFPRLPQIRTCGTTASYVEKDSIVLETEFGKEFLRINVLETALANPI